MWVKLSCLIAFFHNLFGISLFDVLDSVIIEKIHRLSALTSSWTLFIWFTIKPLKNEFLLFPDFRRHHCEISTTKRKFIETFLHKKKENFRFVVLTSHRYTNCWSIFWCMIQLHLMINFVKLRRQYSRIHLVIDEFLLFTFCLTMLVSTLAKQLSISKIYDEYKQIYDRQKFFLWLALYFI